MNESKEILKHDELTADHILKSIRNSKWIKDEEALILSLDSKYFLQQDETDPEAAEKVLEEWIAETPVEDKAPFSRGIYEIVKSKDPEASDSFGFCVDFDLNDDELLAAYVDYLENTPSRCDDYHNNVQAEDLAELFDKYGGAFLYSLLEGREQVEKDITGFHFNEKTGIVMLEISSVGNPDTDELYIHYPWVVVDHLVSHMPRFMKEDWARKLINFFSVEEPSDAEFVDFRFFYDKGTDGEQVEWTAEVLRGHEMTEVLEDGSHAPE